MKMHKGAKHTQTKPKQAGKKAIRSGGTTVSKPLTRKATHAGGKVR